MTPKEVIESAVGQWFDAGALIGILSDAGYVIVPKEPTEEMWLASSREDGNPWHVMIEAALTPPA